MRPFKSRAFNLLLGAALALAAVAGVRADDTEIFVSTSGAGTGVQPNILFVIDTSGSMATDVVTQVPFDPGQTYTGNCQTDRVYWRRGVGTAPRCEPTNASSVTSGWFNADQLKCLPVKTAIDASGYTPISYRARMWRNGSTTGTRIWDVMRNSEHARPVECEPDAGLHGDGVDTTKLWARNGSSTNLWTSTASQQISWSSTNQYIFYSANYLNWRENFSTITQTRLEIVQTVATSLLQAISGVNVGLMRYSSNANNGCPDASDPPDDGTSAQGGMVTYPVTDIASGTARQDMINTVNSYSPSGCTPLSETLYEATQYFRGANVDYGVNSRLWPGSRWVDPPPVCTGSPAVCVDPPLALVDGAFPSVPASRQSANPALYDTPMDVACQKSFIVYLTDGEPTADNAADSKILALPGFATAVTNPPATPANCGTTGAGRCLDELAEYLFKSDLNTTLTGNQNVVSYWIGFGPEVTGSALLQATAARGGGEFYTAADTATLAEVLTNIITQIQDINTTFTAPSVSVNAFNRTQTLEDLYVSVFHPAGSYRWPGNIKKYRLFEGRIVDQNGNDAVDPGTGFFVDTAQSFWSGSVDGSDVGAGGAASRNAGQPPDPNTRVIFTYLGNPDLDDPSNLFTLANLAIDDARLGIGMPGQPTRDELIRWARGHDVLDVDQDTDVDEARLDMGDPLHGKPAVVVYGGTAANPTSDSVVYAPTNDGFLHAIEVTDGEELWAFVPPEQLVDLVALYDDAPTGGKHYGLDAEVRVLKFDVDQDGVVEAGDGDRVFLYFGMGRGGSNYYAVDVTDKNQPRYLWTRTPAQLAKLGQTWSAATLTRVNVAGATQNAQKLVLVFGGGYDDSQDNYDYNVDTIGNAIYMIDAVSGNLLWSASDSGATWNGPAMVHSIPGNVSVLDLDGDTFADRMYAGDMGGLVWRFDIFNGQPAASLVTGGVFADLGAASLASPKPRTHTRRFYTVPDVALIKRRGETAFFNAAIGSGYRGHPLNEETHDRMYSIRDYNSFNKRTQAQYDATAPVRDVDLVDITDDVTPTMPVNATGWKLELRLPGGWEGEKVLVESRTFDNKVFFTTYLPSTPSPGAGASSCAPAAGAGSNRAYVVSAFDGAPVVEQDGDATGLSLEDRYSNLNQGGIAPEVVFLFPDNGPPPPVDCVAGDSRPECKCVLEPEKCPPVVCLSGAEVLGVCQDFNTRNRTFWRESGAN